MDINNNIIVRRTPVILAIRILLMSLFFSFTYFLLSIASDYLTDLNKTIFLNVIGFDTVIFFSFLIIQVVSSFILIINWYKNYYILDKGSIIYNHGLFFTKQEIYMITEIKLISFNQTFWGKMLQYGNIKIQYSEKKEDLILDNLEYPEQIIKTITTSN